jgi:hypothetical protein
LSAGVSRAAGVDGLAEAEGDAPVSARSLYDSDEESAPGLAYLAFVNGSLHQTHGVEGDLPGFERYVIMQNLTPRKRRPDLQV